MATEDKKGLHRQETSVSVEASEFIRDPAASYARVQSGERLVITGRDAGSRIVVYPGTLADYGSRD